MSKVRQEGTSACPNRLTIRIKVAEPQILATLRQELLAPAAVAYIAKEVEKAAKKALSAKTKRPDDARKRLD